MTTTDAKLALTYPIRRPIPRCGLMIDGLTGLQWEHVACRASAAGDRELSIVAQAVAKRIWDRMDAE